MSEKADFKLINARSYKELPDTEIMGVSAKAVQRRFGENLRKIVEQHGLPGRTEDQLSQSSPIPAVALRQKR